jgi:hypothetical protein
LQTTTNLQAAGSHAAGKARPLSGIDLQRHRDPTSMNAKSPERFSGPDAFIEFQFPIYTETQFEARKFCCRWTVSGEAAFDLAG